MDQEPGRSAGCVVWIDGEGRVSRRRGAALSAVVAPWQPTRHAVRGTGGARPSPRHPPHTRRGQRRRTRTTTCARTGAAVRPAVHTYGPDTVPAETASGWQIDLPAARLTIVLSPSVNRGFSGEGGVLIDLANDSAATDADLIAALLAYEPTLDLARLGRESGLDQANVRRAITHLAAAGRVGYDLAEQSYFHRELPYDPATLRAEQPRLRDARALVAGGHVTVDSGTSRVQSGADAYAVRHTPDGDRCTCTWHATHGASRGPCKHILAVRLARQAAQGPSVSHLGRP